MSLDAMIYVWKNSAAKGPDLLMMLALADYANEIGTAWPGVATLQEKTRYATPRGVQLCVDRLIELGEVFAQERLGKSNLYYLTKYREHIDLIAVPADIISAKKLAGGEPQYTPQDNEIEVVGGEPQFRGGVNPSSGGGEPQYTQSLKNSQETKDKDSSAAGAGEKIPNKTIVDERLKKSRKPNPWYDAVNFVWGYSNALNGEMQKMLRGESKDAAFKKTNIDPPMTVDDLYSWALAYRSVKLKDNLEMDMLEQRLKIQSEITAWRAGDYHDQPDLIVNAPAPESTKAADPMPDNILLFDDSGQFSGYADKDGNEDGPK